MSAFLHWGSASLASLALGSIPTGLWVGFLVRRIDIRTVGSGNLGATNVYRTLGPAWGIAVLLVDAAKGAAAVFVARRILVQPGAIETAAGSAAMPAWAGIIGLAGSILGHTFSPLAGFRGGKGVAAAAGAWSALAPAALLPALAAWIILFAATRIVSVASMVAAVLLPLAALLTRRGAFPRDPVFWAAALTSVLILARHRGNLARLRRGAEKPLVTRRGPENPPSARGGPEKPLSARGGSGNPQIERVAPRSDRADSDGIPGNRTEGGAR